ncbi:MAG TPA: alkanesulfonate monooxygenase [Micromonosporaceae bacterium]|nr:alkanesulfonate monooxygenase [Micromonosporaceae bacterium]HCU48279.1 alkanesulfonate monooxygenase [Micromonosporaceae bacterium]
MTLRLHWFMPLHGDGREVAKSADGSSASNIRREPDLGYLSQVAQAIDRLGFVGALIPTGMFCEDPWLTSSALAAHTSNMHFMIALRPGSLPPMVAAQMSATFQRLSGGRLMLNIVTGGDADEQKRYGDWLDHDQRYDRTAEFLDVWSRAWEGKPFDFEGQHFHIKAGLLTRPHPVRPLVLLGGSSAGAQRAAAAHADVYLSWGEAPDSLANLTKEVSDLAAQHGRTIEFGTRFHIISRDTSREAWEVTERLLAGMDAERIAQAQKRFSRTESEGQRRMAALHGGSTDSLEIYPNVWAGYGLVRPGAGVALVGSHEEVASRIEEYHDLGLRHLILSGQPHLEEAYSFGEGVMPILRDRGLL